MPKNKKDAKLYLGVDVGGTKILGVLARASGKIIARNRCPTPREGRPEETLATILVLIKELLAENRLTRGSLRAVGLAVPGIVDPQQGLVVVTPNMNLSGFRIVEPLRKKLRVPIALGNDVNLGTLGERWLGSAAFADSAVGIFVGTGIGGGIIIDGKLVTGYRGAAAEVGHMRMQKEGPLCGCGSRGCLEALASRTAIERDIRQGIAVGRKTVLTQLADGDLSVIRSRMLKRALIENDALVKEVMGFAAETLGEACLQIRHLLDPEVIILGGGVIEACKSFILPIVQRAIASDSFGGVRPGGRVVASALGDDAVALGAVALAQQEEGRDPFAKARKTMQRYPAISEISATRITVGGRTYQKDIVIRVDGSVNARNKVRKKGKSRASHNIGLAELKTLCKGRPSILIIGTGHNGAAALTGPAEKFLRKRGITYEMLPSPEAAGTYNAIKGRKAALIHLAC